MTSNTWTSACEDSRTLGGQYWQFCMVFGIAGFDSMGLRFLRRRICNTSHALLFENEDRHARRPILAVSYGVSGLHVSIPW
eukprot:8167038-Lingulodinium_polyedra.AAC.1